jgi:hypothetical protein
MAPMQRRRWFAGLVVASLVGVVAPSPAQAQGGGADFPASRAAILAAMCPPGRRCVVDLVVAAGRDGARAPLAVARVRVLSRTGRDTEGCDPYADWLIAVRGRRVVRLRELVAGRVLCLEWQPSTWTFEHGELVFERAAGMGAPPARGTDMRPRRSHFRPWPFAMTANYVSGTSPASSSLPMLPLPRRGPIFRMDMEHEGQ